MSDKQWAHFWRVWMKGLKRHFQLNKEMREKGFPKPLDPKRLPA